MMNLFFTRLANLFRKHSPQLLNEAGARVVLMMDGTCNDLRDLADESLRPILKTMRQQGLS